MLHSSVTRFVPRIRCVDGVQWGPCPLPYFIWPMGSPSWRWREAGVWHQGIALLGLSRGAVITAVSSTPKPALRSSLLLGSGISPSVYGFGPRVKALGCYKLWAPELFLVVSYALLTPPSWMLLGIRPPQIVLNVPLLTAGILTNSLYIRTLQEGDALVITLGTGKKWGFPGSMVVKKSTC